MLSELKSNLEKIKMVLDDKLENTEIIQELDKIKSFDERLNQIRNVKKEDVITINVGGKIFSTLYDTLLKVKDNLFHKIIMSKKMDIKKGIFIDRSPTYFPVIMEYLRSQRFNPFRFDSEQLIEIKEEVLYYEILPLELLLDKLFQKIDYIKINVSSWYDGIPVDPKVLLDQNLNTGIMTNSPGWIELELNKISEFDKLEVGGFTGKPDWIFVNGYGANALIQVSLDGKTYSNIGTIPSGFGTKIMTVNLSKSKAKFVKIVGDSWLGIGYFSIK